MKKLLPIGLLYGGIALCSAAVQAQEPAAFPLHADPAADADAADAAPETVDYPDDESSDEAVDRFFGEQIGFASELLSSGAAVSESATSRRGVGVCGPGCGPSCGSTCGPACGSSGSCGASPGCNGGCVRYGESDGRYSLFSDEPLLGFLKDQPLMDGWTYSVGGELRLRHMNEDDRLRPGGPGKTTYDLWRFTPFVEARRGDDIIAHVRAIDASIFNEELPVTGIDQNRSDLLKYYVDVKLAEGHGGEQLRTRVGRQFLKYGSQHLVSPLGWSNTFRNFEGIKLYYTSDDWDIDAFATQPVNAGATNLFRPFSFDNPDQSKLFSGVYSTWKGTPNQVFDLYWLWVKEDEDRLNRIDGNRHTIGTRWEGKHPVRECGTVVGTWNWEFEGAFQFGEESFRGGTDQDIEAGLISAIFGYTWNEAPWTPSVKGVFWYGSGDDDPTDDTNNTVSTLFPLGHAYWGIIDNLNGQNLLDYSVQGTIKPTDRLTVVSAIHWFEKAEASDPIYNVAGAPFPNPAAPATNETDIGSELDIIATYRVNTNLTLQSGYSWFWYGDAVNDDVIARDDADFYYFMATLAF